MRPSDKPQPKTLPLISTLVLPVLVGLFCYGLSIHFLKQHATDYPVLNRYIAGHPISLTTTAMFCVGLASLLLHAKSTWDQRRALSVIHLNYPPADLQTSDASPPITDASIATALRQRLAELPGRYQDHEFWSRLNKSLEFVGQGDSTLGLDAELKYEAEITEERQYERLGLVRILIWATPMLGFLGTVLGISAALGSISVGADNDFQQMLAGLRSNLYVAFDTTALALVFSIGLMFIQFLVTRADANLLVEIDARTRHELERHFNLNSLPREPATQAVEQLGKQVLHSVERMAEEQGKVWRESIDVTLDGWQETLETAETALRDGQLQSQQTMTAALQAAAEQLNECVQASLSQADENMQHRWQQLQVAFADNARFLSEHQGEMTSVADQITEALQGFEQALQQQAQRHEQWQQLEEQKLASTNEQLESQRQQQQQAVAWREQDAERRNEELELRRKELELREQEIERLGRLDEMLEVWQQVLSEMRHREQNQNQELKLRIVRPAA